MDDRRANTLHYGHLGTASYLPDEQVWEFSRHFEPSHTLTPLGGVTVSPVETALSCNSCPSRTDDLVFPKKEDLLLDAHPQLASSFGIIGHHEASSRALAESVDKLDPLVSSRFALGHASVVDDGHVTERKIQIVVSTSNVDPAGLRLFTLDSKHIIRPLDDMASVEVPVIDYEENTLWTGNGSIQQVVLSDAVDEKSAFFAVRFALSIVILQPLYHVSYPYADGALGYGTNANTLEVNPLLEIPNPVTGLGAYADVSFNPWYQQQIAMVDCTGNWSVWDFQRRKLNRDLWTMEPGPSGSIATLAGSSVPLKERDHYDGWANILWVGNVNQLLVCDRRTAVIFRTDLYPPEHHLIDLQFERQSEWILALSRSKYNPSHVFILTSTRVFWVSVASDEQSDSRSERKTTVLLSWRHFRDIEDTSIALTTTLIQNETYLVAYSRLNGFAQLFRFSMSPEDSSIPISVSDPSIFPFPRCVPDVHFTSDGLHDSYSNIILKEVQGAVVQSSSNPAETQRVIKFMGQLSDSRIVESLYCATTEWRDEFGAFTASDSIVASKRKEAALSLSSARAADSDFVVADQATSIISPCLPEKSASPPRIRRRAQHLEQWTVLHSSICSAAQDDVAVEDAPFQSQSFSGWLGSVHTTLQNSELQKDEPATSITMLDILHNVPAINDVDENSREFEAVIKGISEPEWSLLPRHELVYVPLPWSAMSTLSPIYLMESHALDITPLYDSLVMDWLSPLSEDVPGKVRVSKERLIRKILPELVMSRAVIVRSEIADHNVVVSSGGKSASPSAVPSTPEPKRPSSPSTSLPEALSSEYGSLAPSSSRPLSQGPGEMTPETSFHTLRRYTYLNAQSLTSRRAATTASHWKIGSDPSTYDWQTTIRTLQENEESETGDSQVRDRRARRAERRRAQQAERSSQPPPSSLSVPPAVKIGGSQVESFQSGLKQTQSSQIEVQLPVSQVVRGPFEKRDAGKKSTAKAGKKKRAAGF